jgi:hypothetical protein
MPDITETQQLVYKMLTENTGSHILDSGGAYGRHHERNAKKSIDDFFDEPAEQVTFDYGYLTRTLSVFHYLSELELDDVCREFNRLNDDAQDWDCDEVHGVSSKAWEYLSSLGDVEIERSFNTYNGDSDLSQVLQGAFVKINTDEVSHVLIQIHGGCDVRGGYTDAKLFELQEPYYIHPYLMEYEDSRDLIERIDAEEFGEVIFSADGTKQYTLEELSNELNKVG